MVNFFKRYARSPSALFGLILLVLVIGMALSTGWLFPADPLRLAGRPLQWPLHNARFLLGTDHTGRDIAAQIFHGARVSLTIGVVATAIAIAIGLVVGALAGFYGGVLDDMLMRLIEAFQILPNLLFFCGVGGGIWFYAVDGDFGDWRGLLVTCGATDAGRVSVAAPPRICAGGALTGDA